VAKRNYSISGAQATRKVPAPKFSTLPREPKRYRPGIALIGCGGITQSHLTAYRAAGYRVVALCDVDESRARARRDAFYPGASVYTDYRQVLGRTDVGVVDVATHPEVRPPILFAALDARKHVLSQKPFVTDLAVGEKLIALAGRRGVKLAVNQNGRFSPHMSWIRQAVRGGTIGELVSVHAQVHWDHTWTTGTPFEKIRDLVLYYFAIHWFDFAASLIGARRVKRVTAIRTRAIGQRTRPPLLASALLEFDGGQASLVFDASLTFGPQDHTYIGGTRGSIVSTGPGLGSQTVTLYTKRGTAVPKLEGSWFPGGFHGTMAELLCAIEERREPLNGARENLRSLGLCYAAIASADRGRPMNPGSICKLPRGAAPGAH